MEFSNTRLSFYPTMKVVKIVENARKGTPDHTPFVVTAGCQDNIAQPVISVKRLETVRSPWLPPLSFFGQRSIIKIGLAPRFFGARQGGFR
jgi:hypothetical protein